MEHSQFFIPLLSIYIYLTRLTNTYIISNNLNIKALKQLHCIIKILVYLQSKQSHNNVRNVLLFTQRLNRNHCLSPEVLLGWVLLANTGLPTARRKSDVLMVLLSYWSHRDSRRPCIFLYVSRWYLVSCCSPTSL